MVPLSDVSRRPLHFPGVTLAIIVVNVLVFLLELSGGDAFVQHWALIPADVVAGHHWITLLTSMFMHGGWLHILGNMLFLWVFGPQIEDVMGSGRYLAFYLLGGLVAGAAEIAVTPHSQVLSLGASGAIAAVMGVFLITYPRDRIKTVLILGWFARVTFVPAIVMMVLWFLTQVVSEMGVLATTQAQSGGVAYMAHVGGFLFGALIGRLFEDPHRLEEQNATDVEP